MKRAIALLLCLVLGLTMTSCGEKKKKTGKQIIIYYTDKTNSKIYNEKYTLKNTDINKQIDEVMKKLSANGANGHKRAIPAKVKVKKYFFSAGSFVVDFNANYTKLKNNEELMCRALVTLTMTQLKKIDSVAFTVESRQNKLANGTFAATMRSEDFISGISGDSNTFTKGDFILYFANESGTKLKEYKLKNVNYGEKSKEEFILEQLIKGPKKGGYIATLSNDIKVLNVTTNKNICYVDLDKKFLSQQSKVVDKLVIYSIVDSLSELKEIHKVQISINGDSRVYYKGVNLENPFVRNLDIIER